MRNRLRALLGGLILLSFVALAHGGNSGGSVWDPPEYRIKAALAGS